MAIIWRIVLGLIAGAFVGGAARGLAKQIN